MKLIIHTYNKNSLRLLFITIILFINYNIKAQDNKGVILMSSVGLISNFSTNGMAIVFNSKLACLKIQNGASIFSNNLGASQFNLNCEVNTNFNFLGLTLYPNPVLNKTKVKFKTIPPTDETFSINILTSFGILILSDRASGAEIYQGKLLDLSSLAAGSYLIEIDSQKYKEVLKFIKIN